MAEDWVRLQLGVLRYIGTLFLERIDDFFSLYKCSRLSVNFQVGTNRFQLELTSRLHLGILAKSEFPTKKTQ